MRSNLNKLIPLAIVILVAGAALNSLDASDWHMQIDGDEIDGPLGALLGLLFGGLGLAIGAVAIVAAAVFVGVLCAGLGIALVAGLVLLAAVLATAISPLLLPLLIPFGCYWLFVVRPRRRRQRDMMAAAV